jgi:DNA polymerase-3 subunit gamma/tau
LRHRFLIHPDLLCFGPNSFSAEIAASAGALLRELSKESANPASRTLFIRSVRKLLARFNPVLWEDEPKKGKLAIAPLVNSLEEDLDEMEHQAPSPELTERIRKNAFKLESEGMSETIPIAQIRRAAWWSRLAPIGRGKLLIIENSDRMQEEARNSLLKILEEPPARLTLVLTTARPGSLLPTMLSRLRPYRFSARDALVEKEVIRRVFKDEAGESGQEARGIAAYLDSFLPVSGDTIEALAAFFVASVAYKAALLSKRQGLPISDEVVFLGKYSAPLAEAAGLGKKQGEAAPVIAVILEKADRFEIRSLFSRFLCCVLDLVSVSQRQAAFLPSTLELWKKCSAWGETAVVVYRLTPAQVLEKLFIDLSRGMLALSGGELRGELRGKLS